MDSRDQFPADMVEQMLKFTPTPEERALLDEHADELEHLGRKKRERERPRTTMAQAGIVR